MITAHLASIPDREESLHQVLLSLTKQVEQIYVALNGYDHIPDFYDVHNVTYQIFDNSKGDSAKFSFVYGVNDLALIVDDDLIFCPTYAQFMAEKVAKYKCPVSLHGKTYDKAHFISFKHVKDNYRCLGTVKGDHVIDVIGTGVMAYDTRRVKLTLGDFPVPNMADIWFSKLCKEQNVPMMVVGHSNDLVKYIPQKTTIWQTTKNYSLHSEIIRNFL